MGKQKRERGREAARGSAIDFLGYCFDRDRTLLRKRIKVSFARKMSRARSHKRRLDILASYWGWCKWGNCRNLWNKITNNDMSFKDKGITGRNETKDGQRFFDVPALTADNIINTPITVVDFITDVSTRQGNERYAVKILQDGREYKFITNSFTLKSMLDQAREMNCLPIDTVLRRRDIGSGKKDYIFD